MGLQSLGFRVCFRVLRVYGLGCLGFRVQGLGFRFRVYKVWGFRVWGFGGLGVWRFGGLGLRGLGV